MTDPYYRTHAWRQLRATRLKLDGGMCTVPGCPNRATHVDHVVSRRNGGPDTLANTRSLCRDHDQQVKERPDGKRANKGKFTVRGCRPDGTPLDPNAWWNR